MSEVQSRLATRGRSSTRGRGGYRGPPRSKQLNGDQSTVDHTADEGELGELKQQYRGQLSTLKEMFPDWTDMDLLLGLQDCDGDLQSTIEKITEGNVSQFAEIKKKTKDRSRSKIKEGPTSGDATTAPRSGRGRGNQDAPRAGRGRGERGRGGFRGGRGSTHGAPSGARAEGDKSVPTTESAAWDNSATTEGFEPTGAWEQSSAEAAKAVTSENQATPAAAIAAPQTQQKAAVPEAPAKKTWASMFAKPKSAPAPPKPVAQPDSTGAVPEIEEPATPDEVAEVAVEQESLPIPPAADEALAPEVPPVEIKTPDIIADDPALDLTPSKDELTEENVEHLPDVSQPISTETVASTVDPGSVVGTATPGSQSTPTAAPRPPMGGYATTAFKATAATPGRSASYQRRLFEQQEAVVMPGNNIVEKVGVQFGSLGLNGEANPDSLDVDEEREEAETREQPPQHSPTAQPRTALPPAPRQPSIPIEQQPSHEAVPTPKQAPGLPPPVPQQQSPSNPLAAQAISQQGSQGNQQYSQFGRYGQTAEPTAPAQKSYDPFSNQAPQPSQFDNFPSQSQAPGQQPQTAQSGLGGFSSAPNDYSYYNTSEQQRSGYQNYYNNTFGQPNQQPSSNQDAGANQQRSGSAFGSTSGESAFPTSQSQQASSRYGEAQNSGNNTPNPGLGAQQNAQSQGGPNVHQQHAHSGHGAGYGYNHPYYQAPYYQNYITQMNQYSGFGNQGYGPYSGKGQMHGQPHYGYGMSPQSSYDQHSSSPANAGGFGQSASHGREGNLGGGFGDYGRSGSAQPASQQHGAGSTGFGGASESFGRPQSGFPGQGQQYGQQQNNQQSGAEDSLKPFHDSKANAGPSPSLSQPGRPGSATNNSGSAGNSGLPPPQQGFSGYPSHLGGQQSSQYGGLGGLGGHQGGHQGGGQGHQAGGYGYGAGGFGGYNSGYNRGGWSSNYQGH